jgi:hypothetical protein
LYEAKGSKVAIHVLQAAVLRWYSNFLFRENQLIMAKDREGKFHPRKGKPSGSPREGIGLKDINTSAIDEHLEIAEKYTEGEEEPASNIYVRHQNRNVDKREERKRDKATQRSDNPSNKSVNDTFEVEHAETKIEALPYMLGKEQLVALATFKNDPCITVYTATNSTASVEANVQKDFIGFKNKLQQLTTLLKERNIEQTKIERLLKPGYDLLRDENFWTQTSEGLVLFIADGVFRYIKLPMSPKEEVMINSSFYLTPLIPVMTSRDYFYLLVLSKKQAKLYRADAFGMQHIPVPEMPDGVDDVVHFEEKEDQKLFRTDTSGAGGGANFHGMGAGKPDEKQHIAMYFDEVDETLWKALLNRENVPLLLAGVEYLIPIYKQVAQYKPIWEEALNGSHEHDNMTSLYQLAREKMEPFFQERVSKALTMYGNQSATGLTSSIADDIIPAAHYGRISQLLVVKDEHIWGTFDEMNNVLTVHSTQEDGDECLIDKAVIKTLLTGGEVFVLPALQMPADCKMAAIMRY